MDGGSFLVPFYFLDHWTRLDWSGLEWGKESKRSGEEWDGVALEMFSDGVVD